MSFVATRHPRCGFADLSLSEQTLVGVDAVVYRMFGFCRFTSTHDPP